MPRQYKARIVAAIIASGCATGLGVAATDGGLGASRLSAGVFTLDRADSDAYQEPAPVLDFKQMQKFLRGRHHFNQKWVQFPSLGGDWGLGPTFIADKCSG